MPSPSTPKRPRNKAPKNRQHPPEDDLGHLQLPDVNSPEFAAEAHRQSALVAASPQEPEDQAFIDAISEWNDE